MITAYMQHGILLALFWFTVSALFLAGAAAWLAGVVALLFATELRRQGPELLKEKK